MSGTEKAMGTDLESHVEIASPELCEQVDESLGLKMISIRLEKQLIEEFKLIANYYETGYQPLMRDILTKWVRTELIVIVRELERRLAAAHEGS